MKAYKMHNPPPADRVLQAYLEGIFVGMTLRLSQSLGTCANLWLNVRSHYDLWQAEPAKPDNICQCMITKRCILDVSMTIS